MRFRVASAVALLTAVPAISQALGLGDETVRSFLNAPLNAEIELFATPEELSSLRVQLASRDDFIRHGLDYPGFLTGIQVRAERLDDGRNVVRLTSSQAIFEPFLVLLVDVRSDGGRLLREYTLLLDPPTFQTQQAPPPPVAAPVTGTSPGTAIRPATPVAPVTQPAPQPQPAPVAQPAPAPTGGGGEYSVRRGDTLTSIATREYGAQEVERAMIAIFRANPRAFSGNINQLRAGATLQLPDQGTLASMSRAEAATEVRSQMTAWLANVAPTQDSAEARLRLVPPGGTTGTADSASSAGDPGTGATPGVTGADRPVAIENADLARLQQGQTPATTEPEAEAPADAPGEVDLADLGVADSPATEPQPADEPAPEPVAAPVADDAAPGLVDRLMAYWYVPVGVLAALVALLLVAARRRREAESAYAPVSPSLDDFELPGERDTSADTFPLRRPTDGRDSSIVVEETGLHERTASRKGPLTVDLDDAGGASATMGTAAMEQGDPLAEADFHMAYGLYDQAADLVKAALKREPQRRDLKLKLLEVFFVWGNKDQFLQSARELAKVRDTAAPGEWEKVVIMGKQLAPEDVLFHQSAVGAQTSVDLNLEGGQNLVDFDLPDPGDSSATGTVDMHLSATDTGLKSMGADSGLDFMLDDPARGEDYAPTATTRQMAQPGLDTINAPTLEQPTLDPDDTLAGKLDAHSSYSGSPDQTAELALDDLGLDLGKLEATGTGMLPSSLDDDQEVPADAATLVAGLDETSRELLSSADASQRTEMLPLTDLDLGGTGADLDIDFGGETGKSPALTTGVDLDLDVGTADKSDAGEWQKTQRIDPTVFNSDEATTELEPVTMSEVGTKLDLARAYMDMGDPDGARSILNEVLQEGSDNQRQEATRLLNSIPG